MRALEANRFGSLRAELGPERSEHKNVVSPAGKRRAVKMSVHEGLGTTDVAFRAVGMPESGTLRDFNGGQRDSGKLAN